MKEFENKVFIVTREVNDPVTGALQVPADYSQLGDLIIIALLIGFILPFAAILIVRLRRLQWA